MTDYRLFPAWRPDGDLLPALRTLYSYTEREPDRATGWLWAGRPHNQLPVTPWPLVLAALGPPLLLRLEASTGVRFTACCFQAYLHGSGTGWHSDRDWDAQAILSLGVPRRFQLRRPGEETELQLRHGDLLFMPPGFQQEWEHNVPREDVTGERVSLVFRAAP